MKFFRNNWQKIVLFFFTLVAPFSLLYADGDTCLPGKICNPIPKITSIPGLIHTILTGVLQVGIPIVALAVIYSGFLFVFARGNSEKLTEARKTLMYTLIGSAILLGSWAIAEMISSTVTGLAS